MTNISFLNKNTLAKNFTSIGLLLAIGCGEEATPSTGLDPSGSFISSANQTENTSEETGTTGIYDSSTTSSQNELSGSETEGDSNATTDPSSSSTTTDSTTGTSTTEESSTIDPTMDDSTSGQDVCPEENIVKAEIPTVAIAIDNSVYVDSYYNSVQTALKSVIQVFSGRVHLAFVAFPNHQQNNLYCPKGDDNYPFYPSLFNQDDMKGYDILETEFGLDNSESLLTSVFPANNQNNLTKERNFLVGLVSALNLVTDSNLPPKQLSGSRAVIILTTGDDSCTGPNDEKTFVGNIVQKAYGTYGILTIPIYISYELDPYESEYLTSIAIAGSGTQSAELSTASQTDDIASILAQQLASTVSCTVELGVDALPEDLDKKFDVMLDGVEIPRNKFGICDPKDDSGKYVALHGKEGEPDQLKFCGGACNTFQLFGEAKTKNFECM